MSIGKEWRTRLALLRSIVEISVRGEERHKTMARSVIMAVLLSTARVIKVSALYLFLPFFIPIERDARVNHGIRVSSQYYLPR